MSKATESAKARMRAYYQKNKAKMLAGKKLYYENNRAEIISKQVARDSGKYQSDLTYRMKNIIRNRLRIALKSNTKKSKTMDLLGCSIADFKSYIESRFEAGMTWDNWSINGWHIDHIKPLDSFDLSDENQLAEACHYSNMQPMWADENRKKYNHSFKEKTCRNL